MRPLNHAVLMPLLSLLLFVPACGDDGPTGASVIVLADYETGGQISTTTAEPSGELTFQFGVQSDPPDYSESDYPNPLVLQDRAMTTEGQRLEWNITGDDLKTVARRLTDGIDEQVYFFFSDGASGSGVFVDESGFLENNVTAGPDLKGTTVRAIAVTAVEFKIQQLPDDRWETRTMVHLEILGTR